MNGEHISSLAPYRPPGSVESGNLRTGLAFDG